MGCWSFISKVIALLLAFMFISIMCSTVWMVNIQNTAFKAETYVDTLAEQDFYENIVPLILPAIAEQVELTEEDTTLGANIQFRDVVENLDQDDWNEFATEIVPPDYLQQQAEQNMNNFFAYANGNQMILNVVFETGVIRDNLLGLPGDEMVYAIFDSWNECTPAEEAQMIAFIEQGAGEFPYCRPKDNTLHPRVTALLFDAKDDLASRIPERWDVREQAAKHQNLTLRQVDQKLYAEIQQPTIMSQRMYPLAFLIPSAFLAMIVIVTVRSAKSFFGWMGWTVAVAGLVSLLPLAIIPFVVSGLFASNPHDAEIDAIQAEAVRGVTRSLVGDFTMPILTMGAGLAVVGFFLLFISLLLNDPEDEEEDYGFPAFKQKRGGFPAYEPPMGSTPSTRIIPTVQTTPPPARTPAPARTPPPVPPTPPAPPQPPRPALSHDERLNEQGKENE